MKEREILSAAAASRYIGCAPQKVREHIRAVIWKFGVCIPKKGAKDEFLIYRRQMINFFEGGNHEQT